MCDRRFLNSVIKKLKEPHNNILPSYKKTTDSCNYSVSRDEQMALVTEMEKAIAEMKAEEVDANSTKEQRLTQT